MTKEKNAPKNPVLDKEQLMPERGFIRFNNDGYAGNDRRLKVTAEFIEATQKDGLITPLLTETVEEPGADGQQTKQKVNYYSPHQLFLMVGLRENVLKDGRLSSEEERVWGPGQYRTIMWGPIYGFTVDGNTGRPIGKMNQVDIHGVADRFNSFLKLLHTLPLYGDYEQAKYDRGRYFSMAPKVRFNFTSLKKNGEQRLKAQGLTIDDLILLRQAVGSLAARIDPLEYWYDYMKRHPQWRKDKFKGDALLAQELYLTEELIADMLEAITGKPQPSLTKFLHEGSTIKPFFASEDAYASGVDVKALQTCIAAAREWLAKPANAKLVPDGAVIKLDGVEAEVEEYVKLYGDNRSYISGVPRPAEMDDIPLEKLDPTTRRFAEEGLEDLKTDDPNYEQEYQLEVGGAISTRLTFLRHDIWETVHGLGAGLRDSKDKAWREYETAKMLVKPEEEQKKLFLTAKEWDEKIDEFNKTLADYSLIYCKECREKPVQFHQDNGDQQVSTEPICDDCFKKVADGALDMSQGDWAKAKGGEWRCDYCVDPKTGQSPVLYKFAQRNTISLWSRNDTPIKVQIDYGHATLEAKCSKCGYIQRRKIDWGWVA